MQKISLNFQNNLTPQDILLHIAERIKITRLSKKLRLQDMAQKLGITRKQLQNYEKGKSNINIVRLWEIASLLNVDISFFIQGLSKNKKNISNEDLYFIYKLHHMHNKTAKQAIINLINDL